MIPEVSTITKVGEEEKQEFGKEVQIVVFNLAKEEYAVEIHQAREIIKTPDITPVPNAPNFIKGIINLRGKIVIVIDLRSRFHLEATTGKHVMIAEVGGSLFGLVVDEVAEILRVDEKFIKKAPSIIATKIHHEYLKGVAVIGERLIIILDLEKALAEKELVKMIELAEEAETKKPGKEKEEKEITDEEVERLARKRVEAVRKVGKPQNTGEKIGKPSHF